ncbi:MAG: substrate-binding domain-containing protein, partial [Halanaerobiales bacterium]
TYVISDNISGAKKAVYYLHKLGHRKIAMIMGFNTTKTSQERFLGYQEALKELDLTYNPDWIFNGSYSETGGYQAAEELLRLDNLPTAFFCQSDGMAIGAMRAIEDAGYNVPDDFSIVGFDDIEASRYVKPALTTMAQKKEKMGSPVAKLLINMIEKSGMANSPIVLPIELIERDSCKELISDK